MNLILWRHAEAEDTTPDLDRILTPRGRKQAAQMGAWLGKHLPDPCLVISSPARRTMQTAEALGRPVRADDRLAPECEVADHLEAIEWPEGPKASAGNVLLVGHQPTLGQLACRLMTGSERGWSVKKGAIWWFVVRDRGHGLEVTLRTVLGPDLA